jgi:DNA-directed RNA polymerase subunit K/omega
MKFGTGSNVSGDGERNSQLQVAGARRCMISRPPHLNAYEFAVVAALRAQQLMAGCTPRLCGEHGATTMAQMEVAAGCVARSDGDVPATLRQCGSQH